MSAGTLTEVLIVAARRGASSDMDVLLNGLPLEVLPVTGETARRAAAAYDSWGKGVHPAGLNLGDCFAYAIAREHECALLYVGNDFALTDITAA
ncbi:Ribonuclease VapC28 [Caulobacter sp. NIBR1757]|nr:Ribonuclease VapC28 [Caulobacter sp. NIBR1757]